ncbi:hypothetical protein [uncultured Psychroserpens sp.]|uniref:hypothetical protein n=1 Tax=uncultured Psychroserpens sp. TaxID=255436 RepID=UPI0026362552|nr:hypothetical protein [uncultured Psychroserpens sp.]
MKILKSIFAVTCFLLILTTSIQAQEDNNFMLNLTEFTVKFGHDANFTDGVKKWNKCYKDNGGKNTWNVWNRVQGSGNVYVMASRMDSWAEMDASDPASKACSSIAYSSIIPHIESSSFSTTKYMPELSKNEGLGDNTLVWVYNFKVKNTLAFNEVVKDVVSTVKQKEGSNRGYWYSVIGGNGADYFVSVPMKDFAALDTKIDSVWKIYESVHGAAKTKAAREKFSASLSDAWDYAYTLSKDLSMN